MTRIVGAAYDELSVMWLDEDLLHYCLNLKKMLISYIEPHVLANSQDDMIEKKTVRFECG